MTVKPRSRRLKKSLAELQEIAGKMDPFLAHLIAQNWKLGNKSEIRVQNNALQFRFVFRSPKTAREPESIVWCKSIKG
jgi:hypothetical protein